jgi:hypothetical protein
VGTGVQWGHVMRDRAFVVALAVWLLIELLGLQFVDAGADASESEEIILEAMGVSPVHKVVSWQIPGFLQVRNSTSESQED